MKGILFFGDSITHGRGEKPSLGWVGRFKNDFEKKDKYNVAYNLGIPGDTSTKLLNRIEIETKNRIQYLRDGDEFTIVISIGINDSRGINHPKNYETPIEKFEKNIIKIIEISKKYTNNIKLISITPVDESLVNPYEQTYFSNTKIRTYNKIIERHAKKNKIEYIDLYSKLIIIKYTKLLEDGIHFNKKGYKKIYELIRKEII